ncbi:MAG: FAD-dependent oxidoreductase [Anaerolineae bacterium]
MPSTSRSSTPTWAHPTDDSEAAADPFDVVVIGAGLAGSAAATHLARAGARVLLLEAEAFPHDRLCGEFLSPESAPMLERLGASDAVAAAGPSRMTEARVTSPGGAVWSSHLPSSALGLSRRALDALLFENAAAAGVVTLAPARVTNVVQVAEGTQRVAYRVRDGETREVAARLALGAWGKRSGLDRALARRFLYRDHPTFALKAHYHGPRIGARVELHTFDGGYCGLADVEGGKVNLCLLAETRLLRAQGGDPEAFARNVLPTNPALGDWLAQAERIHPRFIAISQVPFSPKEQVVDGVLMLGDAAGLISPLAGNGMAMAMAAAEMASPLALAYLDGKMSRVDLEREYSRRWRARFGRRLRLGRVLQPLMFQPRTLGVGLRLLRAAPFVGRALVAGTREAPTTNTAIAT